MPKVTTSSEESCGSESPTKYGRKILHQISPSKHTNCSLPLLQVWPSQDSPHANGQSFVLPILADQVNAQLALIYEIEII